MVLSAAKWFGGAALAAALFPAAAGAQGVGPGAFGHGGPMRGGMQGRAPTSFAGRAPSMPSGSPADASGGGSLKDFLFGSHTSERRALPPVARFRADDGDGFILQRRSGSALLKFEDSPEIWALTASAGPRGDLIFKNDVGESVLRLTRLGGVTLFTDDRPEGMAVSLASALSSSLDPPASIGPNALLQALAASSARASRAAQHLITFVAPEVTPKTDWLFADAAIVTAEAFVRLAQQGVDGRSLASRFVRVEFLPGGSVQVQATGGVVHITVSPGKGVAGRPSSQKIYLLLRRH